MDNNYDELCSFCFKFLPIFITPVISWTTHVRTLVSCNNAILAIWPPTAYLVSFSPRHDHAKRQQCLDSLDHLIYRKMGKWDIPFRGSVAQLRLLTASFTTRTIPGR